ncbi:early nodulin-like protein 9 [Primulina tabacum]|uniref:early nodulin-like protein 9 n=1 Tax=Primulina tabacum TaxID=48773 RepID=UPI003F5A18C8
MADNLMICVLSSLALVFACLSRSSHAYQFIVGGNDGWVLNPSASYSQWAGRSRFSVNDTLLFRYQKGSDSVLVVNKDDYDNCNTGNPIQKLDDGNSVFKLDRSGPFYFITGTKENCDKGQKLVTVVLAVRSPPTPPSPNGLSSPPVISPSSPPSETSPSPTAPANQVSGPPPSASSPETNPSPPSTTTTPGSPGTTVPGAGNTPAGNNSPAGPGSFAAPACSPRVVLVLAVSVGLSLSIGGFVISP